MRGGGGRDRRAPARGRLQGPAACAAPSSASRAASTRASSPRSARAPSGRSACSACSCPSGSPPLDTLDLAGSSAEPLGVDDGRRGHHAESSRPPAATAPRRGDPHGHPRVRPGLEGRRSSCRASSAAIALQHLHRRRASRPTGERREARLTADAYLGDRRRDELQAARPQDARVLPRRPPRLRRRRARPTGSSTTRASSSRTATARPTSSRSPTSTRPRSTSSPSSSASRRRSAAGRRPPTPTRSAERRRSSTSRSRSTSSTSASTRRTTGSRRAVAAAATGLETEAVERVYEDIERSAGLPNTCTRRRFSSTASNLSPNRSRGPVRASRSYPGVDSGRWRHFQQVSPHPFAHDQR